MLPLSRNTTYTSATPIRSVDLNDVQDCIIAGARGAGSIIAHPFAVTLGSNASRNAGGYVAFSGIGDVSWSPQMRAGDRVTALNLRTYGDGVHQLAINVWVMSASNVLTNIGPGGAAVTVTPANGAWGDATIDLIDTTLASTESLYVTIESSGAGVRLGNLRLDDHHPL